MATLPQPATSLEQIHAPELWAEGITGEGVLVAVIDSGINLEHPDLMQRFWRGSSHCCNFAEDGDTLQDSTGHGTAVASQIAGDGTLGTITGVAPRATLVMLRVGNREEQYWRAFRFVLKHRIQVISMSMTLKYPDESNHVRWRRECEALLEARVLHANSIGDQGNIRKLYPIPHNIGPPGNCPPPWLAGAQRRRGGTSSVISCGSVSPGGRLDATSGRGPVMWDQLPYTDYCYRRGRMMGLIKPDICAPGSGTVACNWRYPAHSDAPYVSFGGTSAATAHVGGCLALLAHACLRAGKPIIPARAQQAIEETALPLPGQSRRKQNHFGAGFINVFQAYKFGLSRSWWR